MDWAYAPGEVKIMTSSDGANFEEAKCWQPTGRGEAAFEESFMFDAPRSVKAVAIAMRGSQSWGYFGINSAALIAEPGPFMLVRCLYCSSASDLRRVLPLRSDSFCAAASHRALVNNA